MVRVGGGWDEFEHFLSRHDADKLEKALICKLFAVIFSYATEWTIPLKEAVSLRRNFLP